jgi:hypothetical protein
MLATVREATWQVQLLDGLGPELVVEAALDADNARSASYRFALRDGSVLLLEGRATVVFAAS